MRLSCGARGYDSVRELGQPLPTERTLHRHLEGYKFTPGLLEDIMESLALKVSFMSPEERHATLMLDEMQLAPGLVYNPSSGTVLGALLQTQHCHPTVWPLMGWYLCSVG
ncbi:hypothetical protein HPB52_024198 [Rhipicephalus sanguineus]|uniref:Transposable element P transposase-like RNase H domain-containing protein n=2 Tax=Rhipicephalus sanguineus TaxID=34632 RepID=A0A9D4PC88_RHISA|nr:hypothetical protein HPB52_024198 [Rhipicephalus sanguineus]